MCESAACRKHQYAKQLAAASSICAQREQAVHLKTGVQQRRLLGVRPALLTQHLSQLLTQLCHVIPLDGLRYVQRIAADGWRSKLGSSAGDILTIDTSQRECVRLPLCMRVPPAAEV